MRRGTKPRGKVRIRWGRDFAYAIGLLVADGYVSKDGRHISLTSKDRKQLSAFKTCLNISNKISPKLSGGGNLAFHVQVGDVLFHKFLVGIGISPAKSKTISAIDVPDMYFFDFLRGYFDGDGCSYAYQDPIFANSYRFYISFASGSEKYIDWLRSNLNVRLKINGSISRKKGSTNVQLRYSKKEAGILAKRMYYQRELICLDRKRSKVMKSLKKIGIMPEW